jgi:2-methylcitrate dehydratase PrpD
MTDPVKAGRGLGPEPILAEFAADLRWSSLPEPVRQRVRDLLLDAIASALAGRRTVGRPAMQRAARAIGGRGRARVIGGGSLSRIGATLLNAYQVTAATVCDVHRPTLCHVTPEVVPAALAAAERRSVDGPTFLAGIAAGLEVTVRVGLATDYPRFRARGWHSPGVVGPFGAAAAVARVLGLDPAATAAAMALAGSQAGGTFAALGTDQVKFHQARGAVSGLLAGLVAAEGFDGARRFLTDEDGGFLTTYASGGQPERLLDGLGSQWQLLGISMRRWPGASSLQPLIEACLAAASSPGFDVRSVRHVIVGLPEAGYHLNGPGGWQDQLAAFQSARYVAAVVLTDRACWLDQFTAPRLADPVVGAFARERVLVEIDPSVAPSGASLRLASAAGPWETRVSQPSGDPASPLSRSQILAKLGAATKGTRLASRVTRLADVVDGLESAAELEPLYEAFSA